MSPRRSSRARTTQPSPLIPAQTTTSSNSSVTSDRAQRATRSNIKPTSPQPSVPRSQSQDDAADDTPKPPPRRTRSGGTDIREPSPALDDKADEEEDDGQDENEVTRCLCRQIDYPGMSSPLLDLLTKVNYPADTSTGDFFLQCDSCKVWQHGGCVGIVDQEHSPEEYFCEECEKDYHRVAMTSDGQKYSRYLPVMSHPPYVQSPKPGSRPNKSKDKSRQSAEIVAQKRRQTLNSRFDQEELERAIEESKKDNVQPGEGSATSATTIARPNKRTRDESHERKASVSNKRQRTNSDSPALEPKAEEASETEPTDPALEATPKSKIRGAAARNHHAKEIREAKERQRLAAANARAARSERRRGDESDAEDAKEEQVPSTAASSPLPEAPASSRATKKKPPPTRRGRTAKDKQTRDQESPPPETDDNLLSTNPHITRARSRSRSVVREDVEERSGFTPNGLTPGTRAGVNGRDTASNSRAREGNGVYDDGGLLSKPSKVKNFNEKRTSMNEMRKRVAAICEFVGRAQVERPSSKSTSMSRSESEAGASGSGNTSGNGSATTNSTGPPEVNGTINAQRKKQLQDIINNDSSPDFGSLSTEEMLENMRLRTQAWQELYGKYGDK